MPTIELARIKPSQIMTGPYSFYVPPYSDYYFHHMDQLGLRLDWIRRGGPVYALQEPKAPFTTSYTYQGHTYALEDYYQRNAVLGFLILKDNQIISERYFHDFGSRFSISFHVGAEIYDFNARRNSARRRSDCQPR